MPAQTAATRHCPDCECEWCSVDPRCFLCGEVGLLGAYPLLRARRR